MSLRSSPARQPKGENPLLAGLGVALIAAGFATLLAVVFGMFMLMFIGGRFVFDYKFWGWPIAITAFCFGGVMTMWTISKNLHSRHSQRRQSRLLSPPHRA